MVLDAGKAIALLEASIKKPTRGLPEDIFLFVSRISPVINVDLLIRNRQKQTLLAWRDDGFWPAGWHVPGGIIRYKESMADRLRAVAAGELGAAVEFKAAPLSVQEVIHPERKARGHFISLLYECVLTRPPDERLRYRKGIPKAGQWAWHERCPDNIITVHEMYRKFM